jgi:uncharacterized iron-regulated protein
MQKTTNIFCINVGGSPFYTTMSTLMSHDSFFEKLCFSVDDKNNNVFIDRDGTHFMYILNYLRGSVVLPEDIHVLEQLWHEADFYCLFELKKNITSKLRRMYAMK